MEYGISQPDIMCDPTARLTPARLLLPQILRVVECLFCRFAYYYIASDRPLISFGFAFDLFASVLERPGSVLISVLSVSFLRLMQVRRPVGGRFRKMAYSFLCR
jgi:hypothetical protein